MNWSFSKEFRTHLYEFTLDTKTTSEQKKLAELVNDTYYKKYEEFGKDYQKLFHVIHVKFVKSKLLNLSEAYESLDASQTWLMYWNLHSLKLLGFQIPEEWKPNMMKDINSCQHPNGGFGGGPYQLAHLATTFGAVLALVELEHPNAMEIVNKEKLKDWLESLKLNNGAFVMHKGGEMDVRGCYCAITVAKLCGINCDELFAGTAEWIASCQTYEGGFGGEPGLEAHGGYSFCALAALVQLNGVHLIDCDKLLHWTVMRQMHIEGGFQGRTNKLVDSCYSFWVGAIIPLLQSVTMKKLSFYRQVLFDVDALQQYILVCCQQLKIPPISNPNGGGLIDKPGKGPDPYHTCYSLSGLSMAQHYLQKHTYNSRPCELLETDLVYNVTTAAYAAHMNQKSFLNT